MILLIALGLFVAGCGNDEGTTTVTESEATAGGGSGGRFDIRMSEFFFNPANPTLKAGKTVIAAPNDGAVEHELVLFKSDVDPAKLPTEKSGDVDEETLESTTETPGEIAGVQPGETKSETFDLTPGKYVMFCNIPGHYAAGMYGTVTVTK